MELNPSLPTDAELETKVVELPRKTASGKVLRFRIRALRPLAYARALGSVPDFGMDGVGEKLSAEDTIRAAESAEGKSKALCAAAVLEPQLALDGPEPGKFDWETLHQENVIALMQAIGELSGLASPAGGPGSEAARFRAGADAGAGGGAGGAGEAAGSGAA